VSPVPAGAHPSPEEVDGLLDTDAPVDGRVSAHVAGCDECTQVLEGMRSVRRLLRAAGSVSPDVPPEVQARVAAALSRASAQRSGTVVPLAPRGRRPRRERLDEVKDADRDSNEEWYGSGLGETPRSAARVPRWLTVAAGLAVLAGAGAAASQLLDRGDAGSTASVAGADAGGESKAEAEAEAAPFRGVTASGTSYTVDSLATDVTRLLQRSSATPEQGWTAAGSGGNRTGGGDLGTNGRADAGTEAAPGVSGAAKAEDDAEAARAWLAQPAAVDSCLTALGVAVQTPLAVDVGTWQGEQAAVLVLSDPSRSNAVQVWVVGPHCGQDGDELLHHEVVQR
jgi:hypothetical protein